MSHKAIKFFYTATAILAASASFGCNSDDSIQYNQNCQSEEKPDDSCECLENSWICEQNECDDESKPEKNCECKKGKWVCEQNECDDESKPEENCECKNGKWVCSDNPDNCPAECPGTCHEVCDDDDNCTMECNSEENCEELGTCPQNCPEECADDCTNGVCNQTEHQECKQICPEGCDESGECINTCPEDCPNDCTDGVCNEVSQKCPEECPNDCTETFECKTNACPAECPEDCDENGVCPIKCQTSCMTECDANGICQCPGTCKTNCDANGVCQCPGTCKTSCDANGVCQCPSTCKTSCDANGVCKCPSTCAGKCDSNGVCPAMCGNEVITAFKFGSTELDILVPGFNTRTSSYTTLSIKTDKGSYDLSNAPCKDNITLKSSDTNVIKVEKNVGCKFTSVAAGTATCTATLKGTDKSASVKVHVLNPNKFNSNLAEKKDGKFKHVYRSPMTLTIGTRVSQGFDFYNDDYIYFSQLKYGVKLTDGTKLDRNGAIVFRTTPPDKNSKYMRFYGSGHAQNLSIERTNNKDYVWIGNYGTLVKDKETDGYKESQTMSRVEFEESKNYYPNEITDHYYFSDKTGGSYYHSFEPAIDQKNNKFAFRAVYEKDGKTYVKIFNFANVKKLTPKSITLPKAIKTIQTDSNGNSKYVTNKTTKITAKDLADLEPTNKFDVSSLPVQGLEMENGILYAIAGCPTNSVNGQYLYKSKITIKLYTLNGKEIGTYYLRTSSENGGYLVPKDLDGAVAQTVNGVKYYNVGYFEPEGIRVSDGKAYISMTTHQGYLDSEGKKQENRRQMVFVYDLTEK